MPNLVPRKELAKEGHPSLADQGKGGLRVGQDLVRNRGAFWLRNRAITVPLVLILHTLDSRRGRAGIKDLPHTTVPASMAQSMCLSRDRTFRFPELGTMIPDPRYWPALIGSLLIDLPAMGGPFKGMADEGGIGALWVCWRSWQCPGRRLGL
jgi:hypothetical protein